MNFRSLILGLMLIAGVFSGCDDDLKYVGGTIQPDGDKVNVSVDSFMISASTIKVDSIYAKTSVGYLGQFYDPEYGDYKSDYINQFYCKENFKFAEKPIDGKIDSINYYILVDSHLGDSLSPMKVEVFPVVKALDRNFYTNIKPEEYCDMQTSLGQQTYSLYNVLTSKRIDTVKVSLPKELGQRFYDETISNPSSFANQEAFNKFFPGLYVTNTYGTGSVIGVAGSAMEIFYRYEATTKDKNGNDSTYIAERSEAFMVTDEVIQMNRMSSSVLEELLQPNDKYTYLKTPAGVYTRVVIPTKEIFAKVGDRIINNLPLQFKPLPSREWAFAPQPSRYALLLPEDSLKVFFENKRLPDNITSYLAEYTLSAENINVYSFSNIARLLASHKEKAPEEDLNLLLVPVEVLTTQTNTGGTEITAVNNYQRPMGMTLRKDPEVLKIKLTTSKYNK